MNVTGITFVPGQAARTAATPDLTPAERARAAHLTGAALRNAPPAEQRAAVAAQFEAILVRQMLGKTLTSMLGNENSAATSIYGDMLTDTFAQQLSAGSGFGLAQLIERQLSPRTPGGAAAKTAK